MRFGWLVLLCYLGAATHPLLDLLTTYSVQLLSPFSNAWFHADGLFIIDLWVWLALAIGIGISKMREQKGRPWHRPAQIAAGAVVAYIGANLLITDKANSAVRQSILMRRLFLPRRRPFCSGVAISFGAKTAATAAAAIRRSRVWDPSAIASRPT